MNAIGNELPDWVVPFSAISRADLTTIATALNLSAEDTLVDLGCGSGGAAIWLSEFTGASVVGVDISATAIENARALAERRGLSERARFVTADAIASGLAGAEADAVVSIDAVMFSDPTAFIAEIARLLRPQGRAVVVAAQAISEEAPDVLPRNYRPLFTACGLNVLEYRALKGYDERLLSLYRALNDRADGLRREIGVGGDYLIAEAQKWLSREHLPPRTREMLIVAEQQQS